MAELLKWHTKQGDKAHTRSNMSKDARIASQLADVSRENVEIARSLRERAEQLLKENKTAEAAIYVAAAQRLLSNNKELQKAVGDFISEYID